jgi:hypothetical protein
MISFRRRPSGPGRMLSGSRWDGCGHRLQGDAGPLGRVSAPSRSSGSLVGRNELIGTALVTHATGPGKARARYRTAPVPVALKMVLQIAERNIGQLTDIDPSPPELPPYRCPATRKSGLSRGGWPQAFVVSAAEIRGPALFLGSAASDYMTGQILVTDGGCMAK